ncbi:arginine-tRNA-protein transferase [Xylariaceae sp. FL1651]|nr:arginine-tRNA-protein transferase [Xylariaceae sp. FL1651]
MQSIPGDASPDTFSHISPIGYMTSSTCGYCRRSGNGQSQKRRSYYARTASMSTACYQALVDRNWRRSGTLLYRPNQRDSCCPHYTLRLDSAHFRPSRDQRQAINRFNRFVIGDAYAKEAARRHPKSREEAKKRDTEFDLMERIHESESQSLKQPPEPAHSFEVTLEPDEFSEEKYAVFENYQRVVHQEPPSEISRSGFRRFLCNSPLTVETLMMTNGQEKRLGSYHQCYRLDGKLVAIGVLDLLPDCVSAVYFIYHESIHKWSPGKLGALREIALAIEGRYRWWYSGFYIHTCPKMWYKIDYSPQQVLNPDNMQWVELSKELLDKFDSRGYLDFSRGSSGQTPALEHNLVDGSMDIKTRLDGSTPDEGAEVSDSDKEDISLLVSNMPCLPSIDELALYDFDGIPVRLNRGFCLAGDLFDWQDEDIHSGGLKAQVAQMAAATGLGIMPQLCLDFRRP